LSEAQRVPFAGYEPPSGGNGTAYSSLAARHTYPDHYPLGSSLALGGYAMALVAETAGQSVVVADEGSRSQSAVSWAAIIGGALAASAITLLLVALGSGIGLSSAALNPSATTFTLRAAVWLIIVQWLSSALGGYLAGRLRTKWSGLHTDEAFFRDTVHGFLAWALASVLVAAFATSSIASEYAQVPAAPAQCLSSA
jgi:hypothetical protein